MHFCGLYKNIATNPFAIWKIVTMEKKVGTSTGGFMPNNCNSDGPNQLIKVGYHGLSDAKYTVGLF
jgi:hypothetical protein